MTDAGAGRPVGSGITIRTELRAGDIGAIIALHGTAYEEDAGFDRSFEAYVAAGVGDFFISFDPDRDRVWIVEEDGRFAGSIALKGRATDEAQLRYFLLDGSVRGQGLGRRLMDLLLAFARERGYRRIWLLTDEEHTPAATHLYQSFGFRRTGETRLDRWGNSRAEQRWELKLTS